MRAMFLPLLLAASAAWANPMVLDDFTADTSGWQYVSDQVMGGVSTGGAQLQTEEGVTFARLTGDVSTANNGGFIQIRRSVTAMPADSTALTLTVRGNGEAYFIHIRTPQARRPWQYFQATFPTTDDWQTIALPWAAFTPNGRGLTGTLDPADIQSIGIVAYGRDHAADVSVAQIGVE